jgi:hypothetical protein
MRPPEDLSHEPDHRIRRALVLPFAELVSSDHPDAGRCYGWTDVRLPRREVPIDVDHDRSRVVGVGTHFVKDQVGIWCSIKLGYEAARLARCGYVRLSPELNDSGEICAVALCVDSSPAFASARILDVEAEEDEIPFQAPEVPFLEGGRPRTLVIIGGTTRQAPPPSFRAPDPLIPALDQPDPEAEVIRLRKQFKDWQRDLRKQETFWADLQAKRRADYEELRRQREAEAARDYETRRLTQRMTFDLAMKAIPAARPRLWRLLRIVTPWRGRGRASALAPEEENG